MMLFPKSPFFDFAVGAVVVIIAALMGDLVGAAVVRTLGPDVGDLTGDTGP
jgi:hypothetical protein